MKIAMAPRLRNLTIAIVLLNASLCRAALPIDLEVAVVKAAPFGAMQEWGRSLNELGLTRVRLRGANAGDKPSITPVGSGAAQRFRVVGVLNHRDQLILPGGAFGQGDLGALKNFLEALPAQQAEQGIERGIFGLTKEQFEQIFNDLSHVVPSSTKGVPPQALLASLTDRLSVPLEIDGEAQAALARAKPLTVELQEMTAGSALAVALRTAGLGLFPEQPPGKPFVLRVVRTSPRQACWPVGWKPEKTPRQMAPSMYRFTTIEISGYTLAQAIEALTPHMGIPLLFDDSLIAERKIDVTKVEVKFPNRRTYVRRAFDNCLSQGRLTGEFRVDEAGRPFYWITQFGPDNPPAKDN
jgi:hypothetical protein